MEQSIAMRLRFLWQACLLALLLSLTSCFRADCQCKSSEWKVFGQSIEGRGLWHRTIGSGPRRVVWIGGIHGDESEGITATKHLGEAFVEVSGLCKEVTLIIVEDINPDGRIHKTRGNARGVDLNRNYPAKNYKSGGSRGAKPISEPEAEALYHLLIKSDPHLVLVAHSWGRRKKGPRAFINFDGPAQGLAEEFSHHSKYPVVPSSKMHGTPGSLGSFIGIDKGIPILTIEYERGSDPQRCWEETKEAILAVIDDRNNDEHLIKSADK